MSPGHADTLSTYLEHGSVTTCYPRTALFATDLASVIANRNARYLYNTYSVQVKDTGTFAPTVETEPVPYCRFAERCIALHFCQPLQLSLPYCRFAEQRIALHIIADFFRQTDWMQSHRICRLRC